MTRKFFIKTIFNLFSLASSISSFAGEPFTIFNLKKDLSASSTTQTLPVFTNADATSGACLLNYSKIPSQNTLTPLFDDPSTLTKNEIVSKFGSSPWKVTTWVLNQDYPNFCKRTSVSKEGGASVLKAFRNDDLSSPAAMAIRFYPDSVRLSLRSNEFWKTVFGGQEFFKAANADYSNISWPHLLIAKESKTPEELTTLNQMSDLFLTFSAKLMAADVNKGTLTRPSIPAKAQLNYDPRIHGTMFRAAIGIQWRLKEGTQFNSCKGSNLIECKNHGRYFNYMFSFYDERYEYSSVVSSSNTMPDKGTKTMMWRESLERVMNEDQKSSWYNITPKKNPYKNKNEKFEIHYDILPLIKDRITQIREMQITFKDASGATVSIPALPPKMYRKTSGALCVTPVYGASPEAGCTLESDHEYFGHFVISGQNIGYEVSGLSQIDFQIYDFKLEGSKN